MTKTKKKPGKRALCACCSKEAVVKVRIKLCEACFEKIEKKAIRRKEFDPSRVEQANLFWGYD